MQLIDYKDFCLRGPCAVAVGKFDGVHIGHRRLIKEITKGEAMSVVLTFEPSPAQFFGWGDSGRIWSPDQKRDTFEALGVGTLIEYPFDIDTANMEPARFIKEILHKRLNASLVVAGTDVSYGRHGAGDAQLLRTLAVTYGYEPRIIDKVTLDGETVSSTLVRECIEEGDIVKAARLLGQPYSLCGTVVPGSHLGSSLGFPTANIEIDPARVLPPLGVYRSTAQIGDTVYRSLTNIGRKPTVSSGSTVNAESFIKGYSGDLYGRKLTINILEYVRPERKFGSVEQLQAQVEEDIRNFL